MTIPVNKKKFYHEQFTIHEAYEYIAKYSLSMSKNSPK
jgi:hypothetical protein